jgi:hypothetical protein
MQGQMVGTPVLMFFIITNFTISQGLGQEVLVWDRNSITQPLVSDLIMRILVSAWLETLAWFWSQTLIGILIPIAGYWTLREVSIAPGGMG